MGCNASKEQPVVVGESAKAPPLSTGNHKNNKPKKQAAATAPSSSNGGDDRVYTCLVKCYGIGRTANDKQRQYFLEQATRLWKESSNKQHQVAVASFVNPTTKSTPLHIACRLLDHCNASLESFALLEGIIRSLVTVLPEALRKTDQAGHLALHYAIAPTYVVPQNHQQEQDGQQETATAFYESIRWVDRGPLVQFLLQSDPITAHMYLRRTNVSYGSTGSTLLMSPLYRVLQVLPDDFDASGPTVQYVQTIVQFLASQQQQPASPTNSPPRKSHATTTTTNVCAWGTFTDGDKPLALLYRRFTRQFDRSEQFFAGDNSRPHVVQHRTKYKTAAGNTWKCIEGILLSSYPVPDSNNDDNNNPEVASWLVHAAVQFETPPDLLRYIVETNAQDLMAADAHGNLPLHLAAAALQTCGNGNGGQAPPNALYPSGYAKYVMEELLYKFPEAASMQNADGLYPLTVAVTAPSKEWIGGGIKSLYDAYPEALEQIDLEQKQHKSLKLALSSIVDDNEDEEDDDEDDVVDDEKESKQDDLPTPSSSSSPTNKLGIVKDELHDAIMLVQQPSATIAQITLTMWANEEDPGIQMLAAKAIAERAQLCATNHNVQGIYWLALTGVSALVNALKAHPNEIIVQEQACKALGYLAAADGHREVSMVASGAVAALIGALQAHVADALVQTEACGAVAKILQQQQEGESNNDRATVVASVSGVTALGNALAAHPTSPSVQQAALAALVALSDHAGPSVPALTKTQLEPLCRHALEQYMENKEIMTLAKTLLLRLE